MLLHNKSTNAFLTPNSRRRYSMCFEFEALYWAKLAEEEEKKKEQQKSKASAANPPEQPAYEEDPLPV